MNSAVKEEGVVRDTVAALKSVPVLLMILALNVIWLVAVGFVAIKTADRWGVVVDSVLKTCGPMKQEGRRGDWKLQSETSMPYDLLGKVPEDGIPFELSIRYPDL